MQHNNFLRWAAAGCFLGSTAFAQGPTMSGGSADAKLNPAVTNSSSIGNIFSPSLYNGTANIAVPIYSFDAYGVSLSYNTAGIRVSELSGPAGLHWNINAAGSIVRQVKDVPDEMNSNPPIVMMPGGGVAGLGSGVYAVGLKGKFAQYFGVTPASENPNRYIDGESDDFMFSVGGLSFTFNIGANGFIFTHPHNNVKIQLLINGNPVTQIPVQSDESSGFKQSLSFIVTDASNNRYYFEEGDVNEMDYSDGMRNNSGDALTIRYVSKWVISKVVRADGSLITYQYSPQNTIGSQLLLNTYTGLERDGTAPLVSGQSITIGQDVISSKQLSAILYPNNVTASFIYSPVTRCDNNREARLTEIKIASDDQCKRYVLRQEYSIAPPSTVTTLPVTATGNSCQSISGVTNKELYHRLVLKGIDIVSCDGTVTEPFYSFEYDPMRLPFRSSGAQDYFGYYNGENVTANGGQLTVPYHTPAVGTSSAPYGVNKTDNAVYARAGLLMVVKNAYGGKLSIGYEANQLSNVINGLPTDALFLGSNANDGVRVQFMTTSDSYYPGKAVQQLYYYTGGQRFLTGGYFHYPLWTGAANMLFSGSYVTPHQLVNGSNHGYSGVTVETRNEASQLLGKKEITYSNLVTSGSSNYYVNGSMNYYQQPYTDKQYIKDWMLGLPLTITEYDQNGLIKNKTTNSYFDKYDYTSTVGKVENTKKLNIIADNGDLTPIATENYRPYTGVAQLTGTVTQKYTSNANYISDEVTYEYDDHNNILTTTTRNSRGQYSYVRNVYNYAVSGPGVTGGGLSGTLYDMTAAGLEKLVSVERWKRGTGTAPYSDQLLDASITRYSYNTGTGRLLTQKAYKLERLSAVGYTEYTGIAMGGTSSANPYGRVLSAYNSSTPADFKATTEVTATDNQGHTTEMKMLDLNTYMTMLWDRYGNMVASVQNARLADVGFTSFESDIYNDPTSYTGNEEIENGRISYKKSGISGMGTPVSGKAFYRLNATNYIKCPALTSGKRYTITFWAKDGVPVLDGGGINSWTPAVEYAGSNGWNFCKVDFTGAAGQVRFYTNTPLSVDDVRLYPEDAVMTSSVYDPLFGVSSNTDAAGRVVRYEYDKFGRQVIVRNQEGAILSKKEYHIEP